jgi:hypothetical protein
MTLTLERATALCRDVDDFSMSASLDNMSRFGSQLALAPSDAGLLVRAHDELSAHLAIARRDFEETLSGPALLSLRQTLKGVLISMKGGSRADASVCTRLRDAAAELDAESVDAPHIIVEQICWLKAGGGVIAPHRAIITAAQMADAIPAGRGGERALVKRIIEERYGARIHRMTYRILADGFIPGPIHDAVARHENYFARVTGRPEPEVPTDERVLIQEMHAGRNRALMMRKGSFPAFNGDHAAHLDEDVAA